MNEDYFLKTKFKPFEIFEFHHKGNVVDCILLCVDFDQRLMKLIPIPNSYLIEQDFWCRCEYLERPRPQPKLLK